MDFISGDLWINLNTPSQINFKIQINSIRLKGGDYMISTKEKENMLDMYNSGMSTIKIAEEFGYNPSSVYSALKSIGCKFRSNKVNSRKNYLNESYFDNIDSKEKAYWLGFIASDGYIQSNNKWRTKYIGITLNSIDIGHLYKFKDAIDYTGDVKTYKYNGYKETYAAKIIFCSDRMYDALVKNNVVENKSNIIKPPEIPSEFIGAYILGYFDGDGSLSITEKYQCIKFIGTDPILDYILKYLNDNGINCINKSRNVRHTGDLVKYVSFGGCNIVIKIMDLLYSNVDQDLPLERKHIKYLNFKNSRLNK